VLNIAVCCCGLPSDRRPPSRASQDPFAELETYNDNFVDRFFIGYFAKKMSQQLGGMASSYSSFQLRSFAAQHDLLAQTIQQQGAETTEAVGSCRRSI